MVREILIWPDPKLREVAKPVEVVDDEVKTLVRDLYETMYASNGVGLASTQIGVAKRVVVIDAAGKDAPPKPMTFINPTILKTEGETTYEEGCLSVPGQYEEVARAAKVWVEALDEHGTKRTLEAEGLLAIAVQHELDHLDGTLFVDRISALKRELIKRRMKRLKEEKAREAARSEERAT